MSVQPAVPSSDTIVDISTAPGRGGIGIVRLAGPEAVALAGKLVRLRQPLQHAHARFGYVLDPRAAPYSVAERSPAGFLDTAVVTAFLAPHSYTGEDQVEISAHGSPVVLQTVLEAALTHGARLAEPGEFTQRAFLAGKLDLLQAEAVSDLIAAKTLEQASAAARQLEGALSRRIRPLKEQLLTLLALLEAGMDFASGELDDVDVVAPEDIAQRLQTLQVELASLADGYRAGALLRSGVSLALVGRPNAGKSSLFNRLLERPRAIVTAEPGTTRDTVEEVWSLQGIPVRLVDTAGLRSPGEAPADEAEQQGMQRSREALADADLVLLVQDATARASADDEALAASLRTRPHLRVWNKVDLLDGDARSLLRHGAIVAAKRDVNDSDAMRECGQARTAGQEHAALAPIAVSALTGEGMEDLRLQVLHALQAGGGLADAGRLTSQRQMEAVRLTLEALAAAAEANKTGMPHECLLMDMQQALRALDTLTGTTTTEDILERIFSTFCIGK